MHEDEEGIARDLVARIHAGDNAAESELYARYGPSVMRMLQTLTHNRWTTEDVHQETFTIVLSRLRRRPLDVPERLGHFVRRTARIVLMATNRKRRFREEREICNADWVQRVIDPAPCQLVRLLRQEQANRIRQLISVIRSVRYRLLLHRFYLDEEAKEIICADLGLSPEHFNRVIFRARRRFLRTLREISPSAEEREVRSRAGEGQ